MKENYTLKNVNSKNEEIAKGVIEEKKSKFISYIYNISSEEEAIEKINKVSEENKDARHVVYIYSYLKNNVQNIRFSDDGEPKGTGTKAIYELITKENITNICIVIVRYFGGILLGAGPLSRAYLNTAREAIKLCDKEIIYNYITIDKNISYKEYEIIKKTLDKKIEDEIVILNSINFTDNVNIKIKVIDKYYNDIIKIFE